MKRDPLAWAALAAAIVVTASAEYSLARACGFGPWVAAGVPAALDIYAVRALRARRDVLAVVVAMIGVNAASHLVTAGLIPVSVPLVVAVSAIAPLVMWRVHALREHALADAEPTSETTSPVTTGPTALPRVIPVPFEVPIVPALAPMPLPPMTTAATNGLTNGRAPAYAAAPARDVVTTPVTPTTTETTTDMSPGQRRQAARRLNRQHIRDHGKPVTVDVLRTELDLSRRDAAELRRHIVDTGRETGTEGTDQ